LYLDTSILVAYYCPEALSAHVEMLLRRQSAPLVSELAKVEFSSAVALKVREEQLDHTDAFQILTEFQKHLDNYLFTKLPLDSRHFQLAKTWLNQLQWPLRSLDALHLAAAEISQTRLVTADKTLAKTAKAIGVPVLFVSSQTRSKA